jgi:hypothetical protein
MIAREELSFPRHGDSFLIVDELAGHDGHNGRKQANRDGKVGENVVGP